MKTYTVIWEIQVSADNAQHAAQKALKIQRDPCSSAVVFKVWEEDTDADCQHVDLLEEED